MGSSCRWMAIYISSAASCLLPRHLQQCPIQSHRSSFNYFLGYLSFMQEQNFIRTLH